jgi:hypothetical protein
VADDRSCAAELQAQDDQVLGVLGASFDAAIDGHRLTVTAAGGLGLGYTSEPPA